MTITVHQEPELMEEAFEILLERLSPSKVARLWASLQVGKGDYLAFREAHFADQDVASLYAKIEAFEEQGERQTTDDGR
ncbi:MAG: hypothetical protein ACP5HG_18175 [Anaerolineae bacterium]